MVNSAQHPGNDYYVDTLNGSIQRGYMAATIRFLGHPMAGPFNWAQAVKVANQSNLNKDVIKPAKAVGGGIADVGDFFHRLTEPQTWTRVLEVGIGGILVYAGIRALTHSTSTNVAAKNAVRPVRKATTKAAKIVVPEARLAGRVAAKRAAPKTTARVSAHRARVRRYGGKTPYVRPEPTRRVTHVYHHKVGARK